MRAPNAALSVKSALLAVALLVSAAAACSCIMIAFETAEQRAAYALQHDAFVFSGTVVNVTTIDDPNSASYNGNLVAIRLQTVFGSDNGPAAQLNKGDVATIVTARDSAACGVSFAVGESWVVGTYRPADADASVAYTANLCDFVTCKLEAGLQVGVHTCSQVLGALMNATNGGRRRELEPCLLPEGCGASALTTLLAMTLTALVAALL